MNISPRCPYCNAQGVKHLAIEEVGPVTLVYCAQCGAIHGLLPKRPQSPDVARVASPAKPDDTAPPPKPAREAPSLWDKLSQLGEANLPPPVLLSPQQLARKLQRQPNPTSLRKIIVTNHAPLCQTHHKQMQRATIPTGKNAGRQVWLCPDPACEEYHLVD